MAASKKHTTRKATAAARSTTIARRIVRAAKYGKAVSR